LKASREDNVTGESSDLSDTESSTKTPAKRKAAALDAGSMSNFSISRRPLLGRHKTQSTADAIIAMQKAQMERDYKDRQEHRKHEKMKQKQDHKFFTKLAAIGMATIVGARGQQPQDSFKEIISLINNDDSSDEESVDNNQSNNASV
jgi:hypothetical protein